MVLNCQEEENKIENKYYLDKADLVQTIIIIAGLAVAAIVAIGAVAATVMDKGEKTANCIAHKDFTRSEQNIEDCIGEIENTENTEDSCFKWVLEGETINSKEYRADLSRCIEELGIEQDLNHVVNHSTEQVRTLLIEEMNENEELKGWVETGNIDKILEFQKEFIRENATEEHKKILMLEEKSEQSCVLDNANGETRNVAHYLSTDSINGVYNSYCTVLNYS